MDLKLLMVESIVKQIDEFIATTLIIKLILI